MKGFSKDVLLVDFETTGLDLDRSLPIQLGAVLLDRETLEEKDSYLTFIKQDLSGMSPEAAKMMAKLLREVDKDIYTHDYHYLDVWSLAYLYLVEQGKGDIVRSEPTFQYFGLPPRKTHDALEDCRHTAEVLRKVYNK